MLSNRFLFNPVIGFSLRSQRNHLPLDFVNGVGTEARITRNGLSAFYSQHSLHNARQFADWRYTFHLTRHHSVSPAQCRTEHLTTAHGYGNISSIPVKGYPSRPSRLSLRVNSHIKATKPCMHVAPDNSWVTR